MHELADQFAKYCESNFDLTTQSEYSYRSLSVCILDCVYSLRAKYYAVTVPTVERYANAYMGGDTHAYGDTVSLLMNRMDEKGHKEFAHKILQNQQKLGGKKQVPKEEVCYQLARYLRDLHIETIEDFQSFESQKFWKLLSVQSMD